MQLHLIIFLLTLLGLCNLSDAFLQRGLLQVRSKLGKRDSPILVVSATKYGRSQKDYVDQRWFHYLNDKNIEKSAAPREIERRALTLLASLVRQRLIQINKKDADETAATRASNAENTSKSFQLAQGRFMDLSCTKAGEDILENLFNNEEASAEDEHVICGAIIALQSLLVFGAQIGLKGTPEQIRRMVSHLDSRVDARTRKRDYEIWDQDSVRRLKYEADRTAAIQLLAALQWKRTQQGAFDLLVSLGVWKKHENLALLRSGFALRFTEEEEESAKAASLDTHDPDELLGIRKDLRSLKVYTIDDASTSEIDDGISLEVLKGEDGKERKRLWIHIADVDRWAPRDSEMFQCAKQRASSLYLPEDSIPMFPHQLSADIMSLKANTDVPALSMGIELLENGAIDTSSVVVTPSTIRVLYRLTYDDVDEMLEEGIGYSEEWELGVLLDAAMKRRQYRIQNGSTEGKVQNPIPQGTVSILSDANSPDGIGISLKLQVTHNAGANQTSGAEALYKNDAQGKPTSHSAPKIEVSPVSSAYTLVTELMILAGEALGQWKIMQDEAKPGQMINGNGQVIWENKVRLPFRAQAKPDFNARDREKQVLMNLLEYNTGNGYCYAWYVRRFLQPVKIAGDFLPHSGLGLRCYVQWTSPIRRFMDLQVHTAIKRYVRRKACLKLIEDGDAIPSGLKSVDLGIPLPIRTSDDEISSSLLIRTPDTDIDFREGGGLVGFSRTLQRQTNQYWMLEYIRRISQEDPDVIFNAVVLGCIIPEKRTYAIYVQEVGLEWRYSSPGENLNMGRNLKLKVESSFPRKGLLTFVRI